MRIVVHVLLYLECLVGGLHHHTYIYVESLGGLSGFSSTAVDGELRVVGILHPASLVFFEGVYIDTLFYESFVQLVQQIELTGKGPPWGRVSPRLLIMNRRNTCRTGYEKHHPHRMWERYVYDTPSSRGYIIAEDYGSLCR